MIRNHPLGDVTARKWLEWVLSYDTAEARALAAKGAMDHLKDVEAQLIHVRTAAMRDMHAQGFSLAEIGAACGVSRQRVDQIING